MSKCGIKLPVKQGEELNFGFNIKEGGNPLSLYNYTVVFQVKDVPVAKARPLINKEITQVSDINEVGIIDQPDQGHFIVHLSDKDTSLPVGEYYLIIAIKDYKYNNIISSNCCGTAQFIICEQ